MKKRIGSFILVIVLGFVSIFSTGLTRIAQLFKPNQQVSVESADTTTPPESKEPLQTKQAYLPPATDEEEKKKKARFMRKDERATNYSRLNNTKNVGNKYEVPRKSRLPQRFTSSQSS